MHLISCRHSTSGWKLPRKRSTSPMRSLTELMFHVANRNFMAASMIASDRVDRALDSFPCTRFFGEASLRFSDRAVAPAGRKVKLSGRNTLHKKKPPTPTMVGRLCVYYAVGPEAC